MSILARAGTRLLVQGITGREGTFHGLRMRAAGTAVVGGVVPGKGGSHVDGIPVFDTVVQAVQETGADATCLFVPAPFAPDAIFEAAAAGVSLIVVITEGIPAQEMMVVRRHLAGSGSRLVGPNCPGVTTPEGANIGIMPEEIFLPGRAGLVSRSGTLTYEIVYLLTRAGIGQSTCVGIGGDPVPGTTFIDILRLFEEDDATDNVVLIGEIGGADEEEAAAFVGSEMTKPVVAYIAGFTAPPGKRMGHAGAIVSGTAGTAQAKRDALEAAGVAVATTPGEIVPLLSW